MSSSIGTPIPGARISVENIKHDIYTAKEGDYWRLLTPGRYNVTVSAEDYETLTRSIDIPSPGENDDGEITLDFTLMRDDPEHWYDWSYSLKILYNFYTYTYITYFYLCSMKCKSTCNIFLTQIYLSSKIERMLIGKY